MTRKKKNEAAVAVQEPPPLPQEEIEQDDVSALINGGQDSGQEPIEASEDVPGEHEDIPLDHEGLPVDADETQHSKFARGVLALVTDSLDRNYPKGRAILKKAKASPESSFQALDELADLYRGMAAFISVRAAALRNGPGEPNSMLGISARNVRDLLVEAASIVDQAAHLPSSWTRADTKMAEALKVSKSVATLLGQDGMSHVARQESPLMDDEGRPLV